MRVLTRLPSTLAIGAAGTTAGYWRVWCATFVFFAGFYALLVHLPQTGWVVLSGDAVHFK